MSNIIDSIRLSGTTYQIQGSGGGKAIEAGRGITITTGETADTVSFNLPISAGTGTNSIVAGHTNNKASGSYSHAEGKGTIASGSWGSHAEGASTTASGSYSHAEGSDTTASGSYSHAEGYQTRANNQSEHASGQYNVSNKANTTWGDSGNTLFSVGNGTSTSARHNAFEIRQNGDIYLSSGGTDIKLQDHLGGGGSVTVDDELSPTSENPVQNKVIYDKIDEVEEVTAAGLNALNSKITPTVELTQAQYDALTTKDPNTYYIITDAQAGDLTNYYTKSETNTLLGGKQDTLVSGTNIKTINNESILGSGNIDIQGGGKAVSGGTNISITTGETADTINCTLPISADSKGIYTTSTYPFLSTSNKSGNVVFGYNNRLDTFGSSKSSNYNLFFGSNNRIDVNGSGMLIGGLNNKNSGSYSNMTACVALGGSNNVGNPYEFASGQFNVTHFNSTSFGDSGNTLFSVGNGTADNGRHNAFEIRQNGDIYLTKDGQDVKLQDQLGGSSITVDTTLDSGSTNPVENRVIYNKIDEVEQVTAAGLNALNDNFGGLKLVKLTQAEYNALATKDSSTLYIIVN